MCNMGIPFSDPVEECAERLRQHGTAENFSGIYTSYFPENDRKFWPSYDVIMRILHLLGCPDAFTANAVDFLIGMFRKAILNKEVPMEKRRGVHDHLMRLQANFPIENRHSSFELYIYESFAVN